MIRTELLDCTSVVNSVLGLLMGSIPSTNAGTAGAQLRTDVGALLADVQTELIAGTAAASLQQCFVDTTNVGATLATMTNVLNGINTLTPKTGLGVNLVQLCVIFTLSQMANIIAATAFTDRDQVELVLSQVSASFDIAIEDAADNLASDVYLNLIALHAQVVQFLVVTEQPLPFIVEYHAAQSMPSLVLALRLYGDTADVELLADDLVNQNNVVNPCFMPMTGIALSSP